MKTILRNLPAIIISSVSFIIIGFMDLIALLILLCTRAVRSISIWLMAAFSDEDTSDVVKETKKLNDTIVNRGYKYYIDLMYPGVEDEEDEEES